ncbi:MAG: hypothetical protein LIQ30_07600 [Planctomycetes bacterium]|nr:hypothetical protein [Planctomycetota bacterium]
MSDAAPTQTSRARSRLSVGDRMDAGMNPVLLRDLRLYMRGKIFLYGYFLVLACLIVAAAAGVVIKVNGESSLWLMYPTVMILAFAIGALVPYLVGERFRDELSSHAAELILASPLTASRLVRGKVYGAWCLNLMLLSVATPVFVTSYLLGGISPYTLLLIFAGLVLAGAVMPIVNIYLGTFGRRPGVGRIMSALVLVGSFILMGFYGGALYDQIFGLRYNRASFFFLVCYAVAGVLIAQFLYQVSVFRLRGPGLVREIRPRVSLAVAAALGWQAAAAVVIHVKDDIPDWPEANTLAFFAVAWAFAWGVIILARGNALTPPARPGGRRSRFYLTRVGPGSLAIYNSLCTLVIVAAGMAWVSLGGWARSLLNLTAIAMVPLMAVNYGIVFYLILQSRAKKPSGPDSLSRTVAVMNILFAVVVFFLCTGLMFDGNVESLFAAVLAATPMGLLYLSIAANWYSMAFIILSGAAGTVLVAIVNLFLGWRNTARARGGDGP